jgi:glycosyltransferase involved in cell wall biosynthesis
LFLHVCALDIRRPKPQAIIKANVFTKSAGSDLSRVTLPSSKIRILHVTTGLSTGGAEMMLYKFLSATRDKHPQAVLSLKDTGTIGPRIRDLGVPVYALDLNPALPDPSRVFRLRNLVRSFRPDLIQGWMYHGNVVANLAATFADSHPPVVWDVQQSVRRVWDYGIPTGMVILLGAKLSRKPAKIVYVSRTGARQHAALGYCEEKEIVIPNGVDCETFHPDDQVRQQVRAELGIGPENVLIGLVARYHPMKDHAGFLAAAGHLLKTHPSARLALIGKGVKDQPAIEKQVRALGIQDYVLRLGERRDTPRLTVAMDIACSASAWGEALSVALGEAMACGVPCAVTDVGDSAYLVGDTGISVPPSDPKALAAAMARLIDAGVEHRRKFGVSARQRIEREFSLPAVSQRYEELYWELLSSKAVRTSSAGKTGTESGKPNDKRSPVSPLSNGARPGGAGGSSSKLRVLHVITDLEVGGAQMMLLKLLEATHVRHSQAVVSLKREGPLAGRIEELGASVYALGIRSSATNVLRAVSIRSAVRQFQPHLIQGWMYHGNLGASLAGTLSSERVPILWNIRQSLEDIRAYRFKTAFVIKLGALLSKHPAAIIYNSRSGAKHHEGSGFRNAREIMIPNGFDCDRFRPDEEARNRVRGELGIADGAVLVGLVARFDPIKGHRAFLRAAGVVSRMHGNARFVLIGKGVTEEEPEIRNAIAEEQLAGRVLLLGERLDVEQITCALDIACSASWSEGFSNAIGEAMCCGVPCVVTDVGDSAFLVKDTGVAVSKSTPDDAVEGMATAIHKLIAAGPEYRRRLGMAARRRIESEFSLESVADRYADLYRSLCRRPAAGIAGAVQN